MNNGRVRKSPNTLIRAYKKKNRERNIILQCIVVSVVVVSLVIISLIHGKFQADKLKNQYQDGKTISTFIEEGTDTIKRQLQDLSYVNSVGEEKESGRLMNGRYSYSKCVVLDETAYEDMVKPTFVHFYGNYPEQTDEIMMSKKTLDYLGISSPKIGMKITLDFYWNDIFTTKMTGKQEFVLSGYYNSYNNELSDSSIAYISKNRIKQAGISQYPCRLCVDVKDWGLSGRQVENRLKNDINLNDTIEVPMDTVTYLVENGKDEVELITDDNIVDIKNTLTSYTENLKIVQGFLPIIKNAAETDSLKIVEHDSLPVMQTLDDKSMKKLVKYVEENNIPVDQKTFNEKGGVLILHENLIPQTYEDIETECIGKIIELYDLVPVGTAMQEMSTVKLRNCGYINISQSDCPTLDLSWRGNDKVYLIVSDKTFSKLKDVLTVRNLEVQINVKANKEAICKQKLKAWVQEANLKFQSTTGNENQLLYVIKCNSDEIAKQSLYIRTSQIIMYTISGILIFMGLLNYFSTTSTNIIIRQREFSIMRSIGMTQGMLRKMLIYEGIIYVGGVLGLLLIIGSIIMGIVVYILKQNIEYFVFQYPFEGLLCIICIMSFLCVIIPNIFLHKMERNSLIERIKKER